MWKDAEQPNDVPRHTCRGLCFAAQAGRQAPAPRSGLQLAPATSWQCIGPTASQPAAPSLVLGRCALGLELQPDLGRVQREGGDL